MEVTFQPGAEAVVTAATYLRRPAVRKERLVKPYRHPELDKQLRDHRTRDEAALLLAAHRAGIRVPVVYDVDRAGTTITMEHVDAPALRDVLLEADAETARALLQQLGAMVAKLHQAQLTHGDLTTSNVLVANELVLIDFGLGAITPEAEPQGVDLHLVEEALEATDGRELFSPFLESYIAAGGPAAAVQRLDEIRERGRYR